MPVLQAKKKQTNGQPIRNPYAQSWNFPPTPALLVFVWHEHKQRQRVQNDDLQRSAVKIQGPGKSPKLTPHTRSFPIKNLCDPCERVIWSNKFSTHATAFLDMSSPLGFCCSLPQFLWSWRQARTQVTNKNIADLIILQDRIDIWCKFWTLCCVVIWDLDPCLH